MTQHDTQNNNPKNHHVCVACDLTVDEDVSWKRFMHFTQLHRITLLRKKKKGERRVLRYPSNLDTLTHTRSVGMGRRRMHNQMRSFGTRLSNVSLFDGKQQCETTQLYYLVSFRSRSGFSSLFFFLFASLHRLPLRWLLQTGQTVRMRIRYSNNWDI